jgi:hypothetical protein
MSAYGWPGPEGQYDMLGDMNKKWLVIRKLLIVCFFFLFLLNIANLIWAVIDHNEIHFPICFFLIFAIVIEWFWASSLFADDLYESWSWDGSRRDFGQIRPRPGKPQ